MATIKHLLDGNRQWRERACSSLRELPPLRRRRIVRRLVRYSRRRRRSRILEWAGLHPPARVVALGHWQAEAIRCLGLIGDDSATEYLLARFREILPQLPETDHRYSDPREEICGAAAIALGMIGERSVIQEMNEILLHGKNFGMRAAAATALRYLGAADTAVDFHCDELRSGDCRRIGLAVTFLGLLGKPRATPSLLEQLESNTDSALWHSLPRALADIGDPRALEPLILQLLHERKARRDSAVQAIQMILARCPEERDRWRRTVERICNERKLRDPARTKLTWLAGEILSASYDQP